MRGRRLMDYLNSQESDPQGERETRRKRRRFALVDIKLLRLSLVQKEESHCLGLSIEWTPAQPSENLSPFVAARHLGVHPWALASEVRRRYRKLQLRYPPEQFSDRHIDWRPSAELLSDPVSRLNWYWQSGLVPGTEIFECLETSVGNGAASDGTAVNANEYLKASALSFDLRNPACSLLEGLKKRLLKTPASEK